MLRSSKASGLAAVLAGLVLGQFLLYGPSLLGSKILLPLDVLTAPGVYLPPTEDHGVHPENFYLSDLVFLSEPMRRFAYAELKAGRLPMWAPYQFGGAPFLGPKFSPFVLPQYLIESPRVIAWMQLFAACTAGLGMYGFCRRVLQLDFFPSVAVGWCYPLSAFFIFWQGYYLTWPIYWLPWLLIAVHESVRGKTRYWAPALSLFTALTVLSGNVDTAGQTLIIAGLFALWLLLSPASAPPRELSLELSPPGIGRRLLKFKFSRLAAVAAGFGLGLLLATPHLLPFIEYSRTGSRIQLRGTGQEERPPVGLSALPQVVLPDMYGAQAKARTGFRYARENQLESSAAGYVGLLATLFLMPLAFQSPRHRSVALFLGLITVLGLSWPLNLPGAVHLMRLPGLNFLSYNRFVFASAFGLLGLAAIGLQQVRTGSTRKLVPAAFVGAALTWSVYRSVVLPEPLVRLPALLQQSGSLGWISAPEAVTYVQEMFRLHYLITAAFAASGLFILYLLRSRPSLSSILQVVTGGLMFVELLWFGFARNPQSSPDLYYPPLPALLALKQAQPERVLPYNTLPPQLLSMFGLRDVRGYDGVDPARYVELLSLAGAKQGFQYAAVQWFTPEIGLSESGDVRLHPVLDLLGVSHVLFRGTPPAEANPIISKTPYWVLRNPNALPRAFVPARVQLEPDQQLLLQKLADATFNPRDIAFVEQPVSLSQNNPAVGRATLLQDASNQLTLRVEMETPGLVVLADMWSEGWTAYLASKPLPVLRVNYALRGVIVPAGTHTLNFIYEPTSLRPAVALAIFAAAVLVLWVGFGMFRSFRSNQNSRES